MPSPGYRTIYTPEQYRNGVAIADALKDAGGIPVTGGSGGGGGGATTITNGGGGTSALVVGGRLQVDLPVTTYTPSLIRATGAGTVSGASRNLSLANIGNANATILGVAVEPGITVSFSASGSPFGSVSYDATGTTLLIARVS